MKKLIFILALLLLAAPDFATTYYVCAATGSPCNASDANAGTSKTATWFHAPGMSTATGLAASTTIQHGDSIIFRGGDTWHFGNSGLTPFAGYQNNAWNFTSSGTSTTCNVHPAAYVVTSCIYIGVDQTWYTGGSWTRPKFNLDNTITTSSPSSCTYEDSNFVFMNFSGSYIVVDSLEVLGYCWNLTAPFDNVASLGANSEWKNGYFHGWTMGTTTSGCGSCDGDEYWALGGTQWPTYQRVDHTVFDGTDSTYGGTSQATGGMLLSGPEVDHNVFNYVTDGVKYDQMLSVHDNLFENMYEPVTSGTHGNVMEWSGNTGYPDTYYYNNITRLTTIGETIDFYPGATGQSAHGYIFNNVMTGPNGNASNCYMLEGDQNPGRTYFFNNTSDNPCTMRNPGRGSNTATFQNNHFIGYSPSGAIGDFSGVTNTDNGYEIWQTEAVANGQGYVNGNNYAPTTGTNSTVGAGANLTSMCTGMDDAAAAAACEAGIAGITYNTSTHTVTNNTANARPASGAWDSGAYQYQAAGAPPTVTTTVASGITTSSAYSGGTVTSAGSFAVTNEGVCWGTTANPTSPCTSDGTATPYISALPALAQGTIYFYRAFATNSVGTSYGSDLTFTTQIGPTITCGMPGVSTILCSTFNTSTSPVPLVSPIPAWGPNSTTAAGGNPYLMQTVGNLTGSGSVVTPSDFNRPIFRCTDSTFFPSSPVGLWGLEDNGNPNLLSMEDASGNFFFLMKANGGNYYLAYVTASGVCYPVGTTWLYQDDAIFSHTERNTIYSRVSSLTGSSGEQIYKDVISLNGGCPPSCTITVTSHTLLYNFATTNCLLNSYNGNPSWGAGGSLGVFTDSLDDTVFTQYFSDTNVSGQQGRWAVSWRKYYGLGGGCDIWDVESQKTQTAAGVQGYITITPPVFSGDKFTLHEVESALNDIYAQVGAAGTANYIVGAYYAQAYLWNIQSMTVVHAGYPTPLTINGKSINGTVASGTFASGDTVTQASTGASASLVGNGFVSGCTGCSVLQVGTITGTADGTHTWTGSPSGATFTPCSQSTGCGLPAANPTFNNGNLAGHSANGYVNWVVAKNAYQAPYAGPNLSSYTATTPNGAPCNDSHFSWNFDNLTDAYPPLITGQDSNTFANLLTLQSAGSATQCPPPAGGSFVGIPLYYDENYFANNTTTNVIRANHTYKSGWSWTFDGADGGVAVQALTGKWHAMLSDGWGQFGSTSGAAQCNIGGPDWAASNSTQYVTGTGYGSYILPTAGNAGHYVYHVSSCSGTCTTASSHPVWPQTSTPHTTVVDNTITWETTPDAANSAVSAINNCRIEIMLVRDFDPAAPIGPAGVMF